MDGRRLILLFSCTLLASLNHVHVHGAVPQDINDALFSGGVEFIDLSRPFNNDTVYWPGGLKFNFKKKTAGIGPHGVWYSANEFCAAEHGGTHLDAPYHFAQSKWTVGKIPLEHLITPLIVVDLSQIVRDNADFVLERHHMDNIFIGDLKRNFTVLFKFGWSQYYDDIEKYLGTKNLRSDDNLHFPGISADVATWLTENKRLVGVGVDTASVDPGFLPNQAHQVFASHNVFMLENVKMDVTMPSNKCAIIVMPMKIEDGTGAPCRITAVCPRIRNL